MPRPDLKKSYWRPKRKYTATDRNQRKIFVTGAGNWIVWREELSKKKRCWIRKQTFWRKKIRSFRIR
jgi:hypothetical protein